MVNPGEASTVIRLFELYDQLGCVNAVAQQAAVEILRSKTHTLLSGRTKGNKLFSRGQVYYLLRNPIYRSLIRHKKEVWPGQHRAIISEGLWHSVQRKLQDNSARPRHRSDDRQRTQVETSPLAGKLFDEAGDRLPPSHAIKAGRRYRYYVSGRLIKAPRQPCDKSGWRLPARQLEHSVAGNVKNHLVTLCKQLKLLSKPDASGSQRLSILIGELESKIEANGIKAAAPLIHRCILTPGEISICLDGNALADALRIDVRLVNDEALHITMPFQLRRRGVEARVISGEQNPEPDYKLTDVLANSHHWLQRLKDGEQIRSIAKSEGHAESYIRTRMQLAFLSPVIQATILAGTQPPDICLEQLINRGIPKNWNEQKTRFGF